MTSRPAPIALTVGEPAGIGPEIAARAWAALRDDLAFFWIGDPRHLPADADWNEIADAAEAPDCMARALPVLRHDFDGPRRNRASRIRATPRA